MEHAAFRVYGCGQWLVANQMEKKVREPDMEAGFM